MPLYPANDHKRGYCSPNTADEFNNYLTITDMNCGVPAETKASTKVTSLYRIMNENFGKMVKFCLTQQR